MYTTQEKMTDELNEAASIINSFSDCPCCDAYVVPATSKKHFLFTAHIDGRYVCKCGKYEYIIGVIQGIRVAFNIYK
jgi:hypothetical protein